MPELPEVEIVCRNLSQIFKSRDVIKEWIFFRSDLRFEIPKKALKKLIGSPVLSIERRAKYILFNFEDHVLISHLGMTGSWRAEKYDWSPRKHDHLAFVIDQKKVMVFEDPRRFGFIEVIKKNELALRFQDLGQEPLSASADDYRQLTLKFQNLKTPIKSAIMNQRLIVGVGNIYASEALFRAGISPLKICSKISSADYRKLWNEIIIILEEAIRKGGSTIENYRNGFGEKGDFQNSFFVYGRQNEECLKCHTPIKNKFLAGRNTFWCPACQKK